MTTPDPWTCWTCSVCGAEMLKMSERYLTCSKCNSKLQHAPVVGDLPKAHRATIRGRWYYPFTRLWIIEGCNGFWKYVSHAHKRALERRPKPGTVVARVWLEGSCKNPLRHHNSRYEARVFCAARLPRKRVGE